MDSLVSARAVIPALGTLPEPHPECDVDWLPLEPMDAAIEWHRIVHQERAPCRITRTSVPGNPSRDRQSASCERLQHDDLEAAFHAELARLQKMRDGSKSLREMGEWCVAIEEAMGGRPPTRGFGGESV